MVEVNQRVQAHPACDCWIRGDKFGTVTLIGRKYVHVKMDRSKMVLRFPRDQNLLSPIDASPPRIASNPPTNAEGKKCWFIAVDGRKITAVVESIDSVAHPYRFNLRITARKDRKYKQGQLVNTPPSFVQVR